ncbi:MAG TPA: PaaI family thioesterase [Burkholderiales bacterium]|jgi:uncharacterized protein (TIGR00369 family)|nr:PaaI family thioesterase [Burkholderiales bacterium]
MSIVAGDPGQIQRVNDLVLGHPFHRFSGLTLRRQEPGTATTSFPVESNVLSMSDTLHAGVLYGLMDATSFLALVTVLKPEELAVTHDLHVSLMRPVWRGEEIELRAEVIRRSVNLAFIRCDAWRVSGGGRQLVATATVTKSLTLSKA